MRACFGPWRIGFYCLPCHQASFCPALVHTASLGLLLHRRCLAFSPRPWPSPCAPMFSRTSVRPLDPAECAELGHCCRVGEAKNPASQTAGACNPKPPSSSLSVDPVLSGISHGPPCLWSSPVLRCRIRALFRVHVGWCPTGEDHFERDTGSCRGGKQSSLRRIARLRAMVAVAWLRALRHSCGCALIAWYVRSGVVWLGWAKFCNASEGTSCRKMTFFILQMRYVFGWAPQQRTSVRGRRLKVQHVLLDPVAMELITHAFHGLGDIGDIVSPKLFSFPRSLG